MLRRPRIAVDLLAGTICLAALVWAVSRQTALGQRVDGDMLLGFTGLDRPWLHTIAHAIASLGDPLPFTLIGVALGAVALVRRRPRLVLATAAILVGASVTTQLLKPLLAHPAFTAGLPYQVGGASWPSGHATASMSLALCAVLVAAPRWRPWVAAAGAAFAIAVSLCLLTLNWHYPSDVLGGYLVASGWMLGALAALAAAARRWPARSGRAAVARMRGSLGGPSHGLRATIEPTVAMLAAAAACAAVVLLARPAQVLGYAESHRLVVLGAVAIAVVGAALATGFAAALRRDDAAY